MIYNAIVDTYTDMLEPIGCITPPIGLQPDYVGQWVVVATNIYVILS